MRRVFDVLPLLFSAACGAESEIPAPPVTMPSVPVEAPTPAPTTRTLAIDKSSWLEVTVASRERRERPALAIASGRIVVDAKTVEVREVQVELETLELGAEFLPPNGITIVDTTLFLRPTADGADLEVRWSLRTDEDRPIRPIEVEGVPVSTSVVHDQDGRLVVSVVGGLDGPVWRLDGLFAMDDLAFELLASE